MREVQKEDLVAVDRSPASTGLKRFKLLVKVPVLLIVPLQGLYSNLRLDCEGYTTLLGPLAVAKLKEYSDWPTFEWLGQHGDFCPSIAGKSRGEGLPKSPGQKKAEETNLRGVRTARRDS